MPAPAFPHAATTRLPPALTQELARLNEAQRRAVTHPDGPLLVVAGPGTGKTQLLAARVAWLLLLPDARPQEILCLTYTDAAARNLRQRLLRFIGPEAHRVAIHTFHSLGQLLIQENGAALGRHDLEPASDLETEQVLRELLDALPAGHVLRRDFGDVYYDLPYLKNLFQVMKREGWPPARLLAELEAYRQGLPDDPTYQYKNPPRELRAQGVQPGDVIGHRLREEEAHIERAAAAVELFEAYQAGLAARRRFDYDDMLAWATRLLEGNEPLRLRYQERFQHFLVDEFQDTNGAQSRLLYLLASYWDSPSLLAVGDDDQSIFRFQGASVANVRAFTERFPQATVVVLAENYRSSAPVLATAGGLIARNRERLTFQLPGLTKELHARHPRFAALTELPQLRRYATPLHEAADVAAQLVARHQQGAWPAGGVGVIARNHGQLDTLALLLRAAGVPYVRRRPINVLDEPLAVALHRALSYLAPALRPDELPAADAALFELLHLPALGVPPADLVRLAAGHQQHRRAAHAAGRPPQPWRAWAGRALAQVEQAAQATLGPEPGQLPALSAAGQLALGQALALVDNWLQTAASVPLPGLLERVLLETLLPAALPTAQQPEHLLAVARTLLQWGRAETRRAPHLGPAELLRTWESLAATREGLPVEQTTGEGEAGLELLTAHGAKGLEWEHVYLLGCQQHTWRRKTHNRGFRLPPALAPLPGEASEAEEARRLFFVALTRAQAQLTLSWANLDETGKELTPCEFIAELEQDGLRPHTVVVPAEVLAAARRAELAPPPPPAPVLDPKLLDELLADFTLSATALNAYLACPVACYYEQLLRAPVPRHEKQLFGSAAHQALEQFVRLAQQPGASFGTPDELAELFRRYFARARFELAPHLFQRLSQAGPQLLRSWWEQAPMPPRPAAVVVEHVVRATLPDGVRLVGKLDRLDLAADGRRAEVLDYKTGRYDLAKDKLRPAPTAAAEAPLGVWLTDARQRGGDYWRQAVFYRLLLAHDPDRRYEASTVSFEFLQPLREPGKAPRYERRRVTPTPGDEAVVLAQIAAVDAAIRRHEFGPGCGECRWCRLQAPMGN
ncbi:MAG: ATP-dependent helicase [Janthinobacterium lividum]